MERGRAYWTTQKLAERVANERQRQARRIAAQALGLMEQGLPMRQALEAVFHLTGQDFAWPAGLWGIGA